MAGGDFLSNGIITARFPFKPNQLMSEPQSQQAYISTGIPLNTGAVTLVFKDGPHLMPGFMVDQLGGADAVQNTEFTQAIAGLTWQEYAEYHFKRVYRANVNQMVGDLVSGYMDGVRQRAEAQLQAHNANVQIATDREDSARRGRLWQWFNGK